MKPDPYSDNRVAVHADRLAILQDGGQPYPIFVQLVLSDLCNQDCSFCLTGDTVIDTVYGPVPIRDIRVGDLVLGPDGEPNRVTETSHRETDQTLILKIGERRIRLTGEHPVLTAQGFEKASNICIGDSAFVRLRMRAASESSQGNMELVCAGASTKAFDGESCEKEIIPQHEKEKSDAQQGYCGESGRKVAGEASRSYTTRESQHCCCGKKTDVIRRQPDEGSENIPEDHAENSFSPTTVEERNSIHGLAGSSENRLGVCGFGDSMARSVQSGLPSSGAEKSGRTVATRGVHKQENCPNCGKLRSSESRALFEEKLELLGDFRERPATVDQRIEGSASKLCVDGIELEWSLGLEKVDSTLAVNERVTVYNFSCEKVPAYVANGVVVHNCAYRTEGYSSNQNFPIRDGDEINRNPNRMIPFEKIEELVRDFSAMGVRACLLTGGGEPTVHPQFGEVCELLMDHGIEIGINTNGLLLDHPKCYRLPLTKWLRVSVDAGSRETYAAVRRVAPEQYDRVLDNIRAFSENPRRESLLGVGYVVTRENCHEIAFGVAQFRDAGADNVRITVNLNMDGPAYYDGLLDGIYYQLEKARQLETDDFRVFDNFAMRYAELDQGHPTYQDCGYMQFVTYIGGDQNVYVCCVNAYSDRGCIGSIKNQSFKTLWDSAEKQGMFSNFDARGCIHCQFNDRNLAINRLIQGPTGHDNFV